MLTVNVPVNVTFEFVLRVPEENGWHVLYMDIHYVSPFLKTEKVLRVNYRRVNSSVPINENPGYDEMINDLKNESEIKSWMKIMLYEPLKKEYEELGEIQNAKLKEVSEAAKNTTYKFDDIQVELDVE